MKRTVDLCGRCAALMEDAYTVRRIAGGRDHKCDCQQCGKRRYGGTYEVDKK